MGDDESGMGVWRERGEKGGGLEGGGRRQEMNCMKHESVVVDSTE